MKINGALKPTNSTSGSLVDVLRNQRVKVQEEEKNPEPHNWKEFGVRLQGIDKVAEVLENIRTSNLPVLVYTDPDVDGFFSTLFWVEVLKAWGIEYEYYINSGREHGFLMNPADVGGQYNVVNGDFTIPKDILEVLVDSGSNVISMDHHDVPDSDQVIFINQKYSKGVYINNQYPFEPEDYRYLSGAQVVLYSLRWALDYMGLSNNSEFANLYSDTFTAFGAITLLSDVRDINNPHARKELEVLYNHPFNGEFVRLHKGVMSNKRDYGYGVPRFDRNFIDYTFTPAVNSLIRLGREEEGLNFILGESYPTSGVSPQVEQRDFVDKILDTVVVQDFGKTRIVRVDRSKFKGSERIILSNFLGLVCSRLMEDQYNVLGYVVGMNGMIERASFRGLKTGVPYRSTMAEIIDARGHEIAFGIKNLHLTAEVLKGIIKSVNTLEKGYKENINIIDVSDEELENYEWVKPIAIENGYSTQENLTYLRYTGSFSTLLNEGAKFKKWGINRVEVMQFTPDLDINEDLILPTMNRREVMLVLSRKFPDT